MKELHTLVPSQVNFGINFNSDPQCESLQPFGFSLRKGRGIGGAVPDLGEGPEGPPARPYFRPKWGPKGRTIIFLNQASPFYLGVWMTAPLLIWRSGSATEARQESASPLLANACHTGYFFKALSYSTLRRCLKGSRSTLQISTKSIKQLVAIILIHWTVICKVDERYLVLQNDLPFFNSPGLWRLLVFLLPLVHSLVCCLCYPTVVCNVIICSLLSQLPGKTNSSQKLRYLSSTCDVRKLRSLHEQSQE